MDFAIVLQSLLDQLNYWSITILMTIESTVIPFPSEIVVAPAAYRAAAGELNIFAVVFFATLGADIGASINYWVAYYIGRPLVFRFANSKWGHMCLLDEEKVLKAEKYFDDHGVVATLVGRLIPVIRQLISVPAGLAKMHFGRFILYTTIGAGAWNIVLAFLGWSLHKVVPPELLMGQISKYNSYISFAILGICGIVGLYFLFKMKRKSN